MIPNDMQQLTEAVIAAVVMITTTTTMILEIKYGCYGQAEPNTRYVKVM